MREYEIMAIFKPHLTQETYQQLTDKVTTTINENEGEIVELDEIGIKDIAFEMDKQTQGYYLRAIFKATPKTLEVLRSKILVEENIMRDLIVRLDSIQPKAEAATAA